MDAVATLDKLIEQPSGISHAQLGRARRVREEQAARIGRLMVTTNVPAQIEVDLLVRWRGRLVGFEMKYKDAPAMTKSLHVAMQDLKLNRAFIVYPGKLSYRVADNVEVVPLAAVRERLLAGRRG